MEKPNPTLVVSVAAIKLLMGMEIPSAFGLWDQEIPPSWGHQSGLRFGLHSGPPSAPTREEFPDPTAFGRWDSYPRDLTLDHQMFYKIFEILPKNLFAKRKSLNFETLY